MTIVGFRRWSRTEGEGEARRWVQAKKNEGGCGGLAAVLDKQISARRGNGCLLWSGCQTRRMTGPEKSERCEKCSLLQEARNQPSRHKTVGKCRLVLSWDCILVARLVADPAPEALAALSFAAAVPASQIGPLVLTICSK